MAHIIIENEQELPGIIGLFNFDKTTAHPLSLLAETLLRGPSSLSSGEREIIASYVSGLNNCHFCHTSHGAAAAAHLDKDAPFINEIKQGLPNSEVVSPKLRALLNVAAAVQKGGKNVSPQLIANAKTQGATDHELHHTVWIAAAFCMYNRYVDGLGTWAPEPAEAFMPMGQLLAHQGYMAVG